MFLKSERIDTFSKFESSKEDNKEAYELLIDSASHRFTLCTNIKETFFPALATLEEVFELSYNRDKNIEKVRVFKRKLNEMKGSVETFQNIVIGYNEAAQKAAATAGAGAAAAVAAGSACATLGPTAALGLVTTFGTASTGTAISALSGAAATNAAVAWFGGGALTVGGGGVALGETILALSGPIGWGIAAVGIAGGGLFYRRKNKKAIEENLKHIEEMDTHTKKLQLLRIKVDQEVSIHKNRLTEAHGMVLRLTRELKWRGTEGLDLAFFQNLSILNELIGQMAAFMGSRITVE